MTPSTAPRCSSTTCSPTHPSCSAMCVPTGAPNPLNASPGTGSKVGLPVASSTCATPGPPPSMAPSLRCVMVSTSSNPGGKSPRRTRRPCWRAPPSTRPPTSTSPAEACPPTSVLPVTCPSRCVASTWWTDSVLFSRLLRAGPWNCLTRSPPSSRTAPTAPGLPPGSCRI